jgi:hypothetical protein
LGLDAMFHYCLLFLTLILCWFQGLWAMTVQHLQNLPYKVLIMFL